MTRNRRSRFQALVLGWALLAAMAAQWLALGHAVRHQSQIAAASQAAGAEARSAFAGEHEAAQPLCQLLDHLLLGHGVAPPMAAVDDAGAPSHLAVARVERWGIAPGADYDARAPPRTA
jgi:hypothetical protein